MAQPRLIFVYMQKCEACEDTKPQITRLSKSLPNLDVRYADMSQVQLPFPVLYTPTLCFVIPASMTRRSAYFVTDPVQQGGEQLTAERIHAWMQDCIRQYREAQP